MSATPHLWKFFRAGGFDQPLLDRGEDIASLGQLDQKLWVALSCPTRGLEFSLRTLELIDSDHDGRIRAPEIIAASQWATGRLKNPDDLLKSSPSLPLSAISDATLEGQQMLASAKHILHNLDRGHAAVISAEDILEATTLLAQNPFNGDGIVPPSSAEDVAVRTVLEEIIASLGSETDRSTQPGVNQARVDQFFTDAQAFVDWQLKAAQEPAILPLGGGTAAAAATLQSLRPKVEDYFARCRLAAFDARAVTTLNGQEADFLAIAAKSLSNTTPEISGFPLAHIAANRPLPLLEGINPGWSEALERLRAEVIVPLLGERSEMTQADWADISRRFAPFEAWQADPAGRPVAAIGLARLQEILAGNVRADIDALIARDKALEPEFNAIVAVEKLVLFHRDLYKLLDNFVSFRTFYGRREKAVFQAGTLYLDQRSCELCVRVDDIGKHTTLATLARTYLVYCDCTRPGTAEKMTIAAAFTDGDSDDLMVGRNGIFYDRQGRDWDATIIKIIDHPISLRQAFWAPYKTVARMIESQIEKMASSREKAVHEAAAAQVEVVGKEVDASEKADVAKKEAFDVAKFAGIFAAIGLAIGALGTMVVSVASGFLALRFWQMPLAVAGLLLIISTPSMIMAWLKLRHRSIAPLLDASGWAVNAKAKINIPFGGSLTGLPHLPAGAHRDLTDPYQESHAARNRLIILGILAALLAGLWFFGVLNRVMPWLPESSFVEKGRPAPTEPAQVAPSVPAGPGQVPPKP